MNVNLKFTCYGVNLPLRKESQLQNSTWTYSNVTVTELQVNGFSILWAFNAHLHPSTYLPMQDITARCYHATQSAVTPQYVVCLSDRLWRSCTVIT